MLRRARVGTTLTSTANTSLSPVTEQAVVTIAVVEALHTGITGLVTLLARAGIVASLAGSVYKLVPEPGASLLGAAGLSTLYCVARRRRATP